MEVSRFTIATTDADTTAKPGSYSKAATATVKAATNARSSNTARNVTAANVAMTKAAATGDKWSSTNNTATAKDSATAVVADTTAIAKAVTAKAAATANPSIPHSTHSAPAPTAKTTVKLCSLYPRYQLDVHGEKATAAFKASTS